MNPESTTKTRSGERKPKPKVTRQFPNSTLFDTKDYAYSIGVGDALLANITLQLGRA
jgi:hypothetical protein